MSVSWELSGEGLVAEPGRGGVFGRTSTGRCASHPSEGADSQHSLGWCPWPHVAAEALLSGGSCAAHTRLPAGEGGPHGRGGVRPSRGRKSLGIFPCDSFARSPPTLIRSLIHISVDLWDSCHGLFTAFLLGTGRAPPWPLPFYVFIYFFFCLFRAAPAACGSSQAKG